MIKIILIMINIAKYLILKKFDYHFNIIIQKYFFLFKKFIIIKKEYFICVEDNFVFSVIIFEYFLV